MFRAIRHLARAKSALRVGAYTTEPEFQALVDASANAPAREALLLSWLDEASPLYRDRGTRQVHRMRGYVFAAMGRHGTPRSALPYVLEELENGREAYIVAAAARAVRGLKAPAPELASYLHTALSNIRSRDDALTFEAYQTSGHLAHFTTARAEIEESLRALAPSDASDACCRLPSARSMEGSGRCTATALRKVAATDQDGSSIELEKHLRGHVSVVAFFYTRCDNPNKCSLTVSRLAKLQKRLRAEPWSTDVQLSAISYDPWRDTPALLKTYGTSRRFVFCDADRFLRVLPEHFEKVASFFGLGVNYAGSIVNQHRIELYVLDKEGRIASSFQRLRWDEDEVVACIVRELTVTASRRWWRRVRALAGAAPAVALSLLIALFPKCPVCWAAYLSLFGVVGVNTLPFSPWLLLVPVLLLATNLGALAWGARAGQRRAPFWVGTAGALVALLWRAIDAFPG